MGRCEECEYFDKSNCSKVMPSGNNACIGFARRKKHKDKKQEVMKMKWTNIWKVMYNPAGYGAVPYYFDNKEEAEIFANRDYADEPVRVAATESGDMPIMVYKTAANADKDNGHYEYI